MRSGGCSAFCICPGSHGSLVSGHGPVAGGSGSSTLGEWYEPNCCEGDDVNPPVPTADNNGGGVYNSGIASAGPSFAFAHSGTYSAMLKVDTSNNSPNTTS